MQNPATTVLLSINGRSVSAPEGASVAAVLLANGIPTRTSVAGEPRAALCGMDICMECRATVDGVPHVRTCQVTVHAHMQVVTE